MIDEAHLLLETTELPENRSKRACELLSTAVKIAIERNTKLVLNFALGRRYTATTQIFIEGLRAATSHHRFQITCDAFRPYVPAIADTLGDRVSFAQLIKVYGTTEEGREARYNPLRSWKRRRSQFLVIPFLAEFAPASFSARTSRSECRCAA